MPQAASLWRAGPVPLDPLTTQMHSATRSLIPLVNRGLKAALVSALATSLPALAQVAPQNRATVTTAEEMVTLSPFVVATEKETGWSANDTLSATRTKQALTRRGGTSRRPST